MLDSVIADIERGTMTGPTVRVEVTLFSDRFAVQAQWYADFCARRTSPNFRI